MAGWPVLPAADFASAGCRMARILGVDPGSRITGFGIIDVRGASIRHVAHGAIRTADGAFPQRLRCIFNELSAVLEEYRPDAVAIEQVFVNRNVDSALKLGQARGAAICAAAVRELPIAEYTPTQVKQAVVGTGAAGKEQVQFMVRALLKIAQALQPDAADALAVALCHNQHSPLEQRLARLRREIT
jgi:crossover junction endodeoxyribonuclease RuvC